jgi:hypothetical protein
MRTTCDAIILDARSGRHASALISATPAIFRCTRPNSRVPGDILSVLDLSNVLCPPSEIPPALIAVFRRRCTSPACSGPTPATLRHILVRYDEVFQARHISKPPAQRSSIARECDSRLLCSACLRQALQARVRPAAREPPCSIPTRFCQRLAEFSAAKATSGASFIFPNSQRDTSSDRVQSRL